MTDALFETPVTDNAGQPAAATGHTSSEPPNPMLGSEDPNVSLVSGRTSETNGAAASPGAAAAPTLIVTVHGTPAPQGSKRHVGHGVMIESSKKVKPWREAVKWAVLEACGVVDPTFGVRLDGPVRVEVTFTLPRPKGHYRTGRNYLLLRDAAPSVPAGTPDLDKLVRSTLDAISEAGVWRDDAQVVTLRAAKRYPGVGLDALPHAGAVIRIKAVSP